MGTKYKEADNFIFSVGSSAIPPPLPLPQKNRLITLF